jgi:hypothetical protein
VVTAEAKTPNVYFFTNTYPEESESSGLCGVPQAALRKSCLHQIPQKILQIASHTKQTLNQKLGFPIVHNADD